jgi:CRP/FNR family transcriptional regulator
MFSNIEAQEIESICVIKKDRSFKKGEIIIQEGDKISELVYLKSGLVKYYSVLENGKNHILSIAKPFDTISLLNTFNKGVSLYNLSALEDSVLCYIPLDGIQSLIKTNGKFAFDFIEKYNKVANKTIHQLMLINSKNISGRIAFVLLQFAQEMYKSNSFELPISRKEIADLIGMSTENVIRSLSEFRQNKIIKINGKEIEIVDMERLNQISQYG